jgi:hypothetical protein
MRDSLRIFPKVEKRHDFFFDRKLQLYGRKKFEKWHSLVQSGFTGVRLLLPVFLHNPSHLPLPFFVDPVISNGLRRQNSKKKSS